MIQATFEGRNLAELDEVLDDFVDELLTAGMKKWTVAYWQSEFYREGFRVQGWQAEILSSFTPPDAVRQTRDEDIAATEAKYDEMFTRAPVNFTGEDAEQIKALLKDDGVQ